jgi:hypothetical protein
MILHGCQGNAPPADGVTLLAVAPHLPAMKVRVTIGTLLPYLGKQKVGVAFPAIHSLMHAAKRITSLRMPEIREWPDRFVTRSGVAILARHLNRSVRTAGLRALLFHIPGCGFAGIVEPMAPGA